jgi:hypothetical protein
MNPRDTLKRFDEVLEEEREAIRRLDGERVEATSTTKYALALELEKLDGAARAQIAPELRTLRAQILRNGVLLIHARGILTDVIRMRSNGVHASQTTLTRGPVPQVGVGLSIRG